MNSFRFCSTAIFALGSADILPAESVPEGKYAWRKSQILSGKSADQFPIRKLPTLSAQFKATGLPDFQQEATKVIKDSHRIFQIGESMTPEFRQDESAPDVHQKGQTLSDRFRKLSTLSRELLRSKIQTPPGKFRRRRLRDSQFSPRSGGAA